MITNLLRELRLSTEGRIKRGQVREAIECLSDACQADAESFTQVDLSTDDVLRLRDLLDAANARMKKDEGE